MKCWNCGAEVPERRTSCPNCAANLSSPTPDMPEDKENSLDKYRSSIRLFRRLCFVEWLCFFWGGIAPLMVQITSFSDTFWKKRTVQGLIWPMIIAGTVGLLFFELFTFKAMTRYEDSFSRVMKAKIAVVALPVSLGATLVSGFAWTLLGSILNIILILTEPLLLAIVIVSAYYDYSYCWALSSYVQVLSSKQAKRLDRWGAFLPVLSVILLGSWIFTFFLNMAGASDVSGLTMFLISNVALMSVIPVLMSWTYRICRSELKKR